jgi:LmbE family N-acetylglucosaminyl deacetylase
LLILGAHPDDAEFRAGGLAAIYRSLGHTVKMVSVTDGGAGHHAMNGPELIARRHKEAADAAAIIGAHHEVWEYPDGSLQPTLEVRERIIREIRTFGPDLVLTHRPDDYHPDHRAVGHAVRDASYLVTVPLVVPEVPILRKDPVVAYLYDHFTKPYPFQPDAVVDVTAHLGKIHAMLAAHESQLFEWLPFNRRERDNVPNDPTIRNQVVADFYRERAQGLAAKYQQLVIATFGSEKARHVEWVEVYEISEYASAMSAELKKELFPVT